MALEYVLLSSEAEKPNAIISAAILHPRATEIAPAFGNALEKQADSSSPHFQNALQCHPHEEQYDPETIVVETPKKRSQLAHHNTLSGKEVVKQADGSSPLVLNALEAQLEN